MKHGMKPHRQRILALWLCAIMLFPLAACGAGMETLQIRPNPTAEPLASPQLPTPTPMPAPTEEPPEPEAEASLPGVGVEPDGTFNESALFIGDSLTAGLIQRLRATERLGGARYMAICSYAMQSFFGGPYLNESSAEQYGMECSPEFYGQSYAQAVRTAGESVGAIYYMLGTNGSQNVTPENYISILEYLRECCPDAAIYAQTIPYSEYALSDYAHVNGVVVESVEALRAAGDQKIYVLDTFTAIGTQHMSGDGLHLNADGQELWYALIAGEYAN